MVLKFRQRDGDAFHYWGYFLEYESDPAKTWVGPQIGMSIKPDSSEQFTGIFDRTGKEIYQNDYVKEIDTGYIGKVTLISDMGFPRWEIVNSWTESMMYDVECLEVVGNVYDNPELADV